MFITPIKDEEWYLGEGSAVIFLSDLLQPFEGLCPFVYLHRSFLKNFDQECIADCKYMIVLYS